MVFPIQTGEKITAMFCRLPPYDEIKKFFIDKKTTLSQWSEQHGFDRGLVRDVATGRNHGTKGISSLIKKALLREFYQEEG